MNTIEDDGFNYHDYMRETPPDVTKIRRGLADRQHRFDAAITRLSVRIDEDLLNQFSQLVSAGQSCERLINQALREWLSIRGIKELIRSEVQQAVQSLSPAQSRPESPQS